MKLSQKLLALSGVAVADYACCAYDDYGIPSDCGLSEKTPFAGDPWRGNQCKSWEANVDASFDGNDSTGCVGAVENDWSSCGFQRHFPWQSTGADLGYTTGALGTQDIVAFTSLTFGMGAGDEKYTIGGAPFLGGVCKLWMPVALANIHSVNIAGVHLSGSGDHRSDATYAGEDGSVHCFSVVNPSEFLSNDDNIHNGNVAGWRDAGVDAAGDGMQSDVFPPGTSQTDRQQGKAHQWYENSSAPQTAFGSGAADFAGDSNVGPNFDVVAHFKHAHCASFWTNEDMQMTGDWDSGVVDYPLGNIAVPENAHDHTDTTDKRFANDLNGINDKYDCVDAGCANADGMTMGGAEIYRWPNFGAFAGFYSFVACANVDSDGAYDVLNAYKYVFHRPGPGNCVMTGTEITGTADVALQQECFISRSVVVSLANDDFRAEDCGASNRRLTARWNVRQAGTAIRNCGPGTLPDGDSGRCSWNWNFNTFARDGVDIEEPEAFFERSSPRDFLPWQSGAAVGRFAQEGSPTDPISDVTITSVLTNAAGGVLTGTITLDVPATYATVTEELDASTGGTHTVVLGCQSGGGARDTFPDCFQGEEIHYEWTCNADNCDADNRLDPWASVVSATFV